ncbi:MAG TPA: SpoIIE family protein phosphatase [Chthoniobacterales bacterium]
MTDRGTSFELDDLRRSLVLYKGLVKVSALINAIKDLRELLPDILPSTDLLSLAVHYRPAREVAGDFYEVVPGLEFPANQINLLPGDHAIFYTDGLVESFNGAREPFALNRVLAVLTRPLEGAKNLVEALTMEETTHRGDVAPHDDLTILAVGLK